MEVTKIVTHGGVFHADDVMAVAILRRLYPDARIERTFNAAPEEGAVIVDMGGQYDPAKGLYDHHQTGGAGTHANGIPLASAGLVWQRYGAAAVAACLPQASACVVEKIALAISERLIQPLDAHDNGVPLYADETPAYNSGSRGPIRPVTLSRVISGMNPADRAKADEAFQGAVHFMDGVLAREIEYVGKAAMAEAVVQAASAVDGILQLEEFVPWQDAIGDRPDCAALLFVTFPSLRGGYSAQGVPVSPGDKAVRVRFPSAWGGLPAAELAEKCGVPDATFCHNAGFIASAMSREGVTAMARLAITAAPAAVNV